LTKENELSIIKHFSKESFKKKQQAYFRLNVSENIHKKEGGDKQRYF